MALNPDASLEILFYADYEDDVLVVGGLRFSDESGAGFVGRLDGHTLRLKWQERLPAFNVGEGIIESNSAYVTAHGFIGKVDLSSGSFIWSHSDLFRAQDTFNAFELPEVGPETVSFRESTSDKHPAQTIRVQKKSGEILAIQ